MQPTTETLLVIVLSGMIGTWIGKVVAEVIQAIRESRAKK